MKGKKEQKGSGAGEQMSANLGPSIAQTLASQMFSNPFPRSKPGFQLVG
jgi:hypothetical protein